MKHLSAIPEPPSRATPDVPRDLDLIVLRALAKNPQQPLPVGRGDGRRPRARRPRRSRVATRPRTRRRWCSRAPPARDAAPTTVTRPPPPVAPRPPVRHRRRRAGYYGYEEPPRGAGRSGRGCSPAAARRRARSARWFAYKQIQRPAEREQAGRRAERRRGQAGPGGREDRRDAGLTPSVVRESSEHGRSRASSSARTRRRRQPHRQGQHRDDHGLERQAEDRRCRTCGASAEHEQSRRSRTRSLTSKVAQVFSDKPPGTVTAQDPKPGTRVAEGTVVHINVSAGRQAGRPCRASSGGRTTRPRAELSAQGSRSARSDVDSTSRRAPCVAQDPARRTPSSRRARR